MEGCKLERELAYQKQTASRALDGLSPVSGPVIDRYSRCRDWRYFEKEAVFHFAKEYADGRNDLKICEFGCGDGTNSCQAALVIPHANVCGLDISPELIDVAQKKAVINGVDKRVHFIVGDVEQDLLGIDCFDMVLILSVLHHVDVRKTFPLLLKAVKPGGMLIILEPIAFSQNLQRLRDLLPLSKDVSPDERQLNEVEIAFLSDSLERRSIHYFNLFGRLSRLLPNRHRIDKGHFFTKAALKFLRLLDMGLFAAIPYLRRFAGRVLIVGYKPISSD
jgi:2-polyprenyl-3-methyl-5-hydroxy-6-metoxy-1,4-benzoquinol methylase